MPPLKERCQQLDMLCQMFDAQSVTWRFDPICFYVTNEVHIHNNLHDFALIADRAFHSDVSRCITSFMDDYPKIRKRVARLPGFAFIDPPLATKREILLDIKKTLAAKNIDLYTCCEKQVLETLPADAMIKSSACIPNRLLVDLFGGNLNFKKDAGQRIKDGCGCMVSVDIGSYRLHPCYHNCLFCYANPSPENKPKGIAGFFEADTMPAGSMHRNPKNQYPSVSQNTFCNGLVAVLTKLRINADILLNENRFRNP